MDVSPSRPLSWNNLEGVAPSPSPTPDQEVQRWLIDGYNVLHAALLSGGLREQIRWWGSEGRNLLVARVLKFDALAAADTTKQGSEDETENADKLPLRGDAVRISVVFDGAAPPPEPVHPHRLVEVIFAPSADDYLVSHVRRSDSVENLMVVSNDRRVIGRCKSAGANIVSAQNFIARCEDVEQEANE